MIDLQNLSQNPSPRVQAPVSARPSAADDRAARADFLSLAAPVDRQGAADSGKSVPAAPESSGSTPAATTDTPDPTLEKVRERPRAVRRLTVAPPAAATTSPTAAPALPSADGTDAAPDDKTSDKGDDKTATDGLPRFAAVPLTTPILAKVEPTAVAPAATDGVAAATITTAAAPPSIAPPASGNAPVGAEIAAAAAVPPSLAGVARRIVSALRSGVASPVTGSTIDGGSMSVAIEPGAAPSRAGGDAAARPLHLTTAEAKAPAVTALATATAPADEAAVRPASVAFGAAMRAALQADDPQTAADGTPPPAGDPMAALASLQVPGAPQAATAAPAAPAVVLDTSNDRWMQGMMDHIERVKDAANAGDTRIRMSPDALGNVGVSIRQQGDTIHVHFTAASAETRSLLTDAQPQLAQIAGERGLTLGQSSVDAGTGQQSRQPSPQPAAPVANLSTAAARTAADDTITDDRLA